MSTAVDNTYQTKDANLRTPTVLSENPMERADGVDPRSIPGSGWDTPVLDFAGKAAHAAAASERRAHAFVKTEYNKASLALGVNDEPWATMRLNVLDHSTLNIWLHAERAGLNRDGIFAKYGQPLPMEGLDLPAKEEVK